MRNKLLLVTLIVSLLLLSACSSGYTQEDMDSMKESYESQIAELQNTISELETKIEKLESTPSIPAGMSDAIYSYGVAMLSATDSYLSGTTTASECHENTKSFMSDLILSNKTSLSLVDSECYDNMVLCYTTLTKLSEEDYSKYTLDELQFALSEARKLLANSLGMQ